MDIHCVLVQLELSPLLAACERGQTSTAELLIDKGADMNKCDKVNKTLALSKYFQDYNNVSVANGILTTSCCH